MAGIKQVDGGIASLKWVQETDENLELLRSFLEVPDVEQPIVCEAGANPFLVDGADGQPMDETMNNSQIGNTTAAFAGEPETGAEAGQRESLAGIIVAGCCESEENLTQFYQQPSQQESSNEVQADQKEDICGEQPCVD